MSDRFDTADDGDEDVGAEYKTEEEQLERNPGEQGKWTSLAIAVLGAWLIISPWIFEIEFAEVMGFNSVFAGALLALLGGYNYHRRSDERLASVGVAGFAGLIGLWLLVSPWVFTLGVDDLVGWNYIVVGIIVGVLGLFSSYEARDQDIEAVSIR